MLYIVAMPSQGSWMRRGMLLAALSATVGCGSSAQPTVAGITARESAATLQTVAPKQPPEFSLDAKAFHDEIVENVKVGAKKYGERDIELTGKVSYIGRHTLDHKEPPAIILDAGPQRGVVCNTVDREPWLRCAHGQTVKVRGKVASAAMLHVGIELNQCQFTVVAGDAATPLTVADLVKEIAADEDAAEKLYNGKAVLLTGELVAVDGRDVELKGDGKRPIRCHGISSDDFFLKPLKPGAPVTFLGVLKITNAGKLKLLKDKVDLEAAILTRAPSIPK